MTPIKAYIPLALNREREIKIAAEMLTRATIEQRRRSYEVACMGL